MASTKKLLKKAKKLGLPVKGNEDKKTLRAMIEAWKEAKATGKDGKKSSKKKDKGGKTSKKKSSRNDDDDDDDDEDEDEEETVKIDCGKSKIAKVFMKRLLKKFEDTEKQFYADGTMALKLGRTKLLDVYNVEQVGNDILCDLIVPVPMKEVKSLGFRDKAPKGYGLFTDYILTKKPSEKVVKAVKKAYNKFVD